MKYKRSCRKQVFLTHLDFCAGLDGYPAQTCAKTIAATPHMIPM
ncbi:hypothetical protein [Diplocloster hominis]